MNGRAPWRRLKELVTGLRLGLELQLGRQRLLFAVADAALLVVCLLDALVAPDFGGRRLYVEVVLLPLLLLGLPALADVVALERRAGSLELALAAPAGEGYFLRRAGAVGCVLALQGTLLLLLGWQLTGHAFPLLTVALQVVAVSGFVVSVALFWAVRLASAGATWLASLGSTLAAAPLSLYLPMPSGQEAAFSGGGAWLPGAWAGWQWLQHWLALVAVSVLLVLYARRRLRRPDALLKLR